MVMAPQKAVEHFAQYVVCTRPILILTGLSSHPKLITKIISSCNPALLRAGAPFQLPIELNHTLFYSAFWKDTQGTRGPCVI